MESYAVRHLNFSYPQQNQKVLDDLSFSIAPGQFVALCGPSGCGKTTLLRQLKTTLTPKGERSGEIYFEGRPLSSLDRRTQSSRIGFVMQSPDNQLVTDKVWHELAFGMESLGFDTPVTRLRVAEMASFFGIQNWFHHRVQDLSGGQKQLLNLAAIMVMQPSVLILDEPIGQLDPIAAAELLAAISKINRELGVTVIMTEHRLEEVFPRSDRVLVMEAGKIIFDGTPQGVGERLREGRHSMFLAVPVPMRICAGVENDLVCPITVREGRDWLDQFAKQHLLGEVPVSAANKPAGGHAGISANETGSTLSGTRQRPAVELIDVWFRYAKDAPDIIKGLSLTVFPGEFYAILGGNGTGKTTALSLISGINKPYRGKARLYGQEGGKPNGQSASDRVLGVLPQNPQALFIGKTVKEDLYELLQGLGLSETEKEERVCAAASLCRLSELLFRHPYDLSGGEQQRAALAKVLLLQPKILLLDEPTKGLDAEFKQVLAAILQQLLQEGAAIIMVSHDLEFCAQYAHRCALFFDGSIISTDLTRRFFTGNSFYTTAANRMARHRLPGAVTPDDVIAACSGKTGSGSPFPHASLQSAESIRIVGPASDFYPGEAKELAATIETMETMKTTENTGNIGSTGNTENTECMASASGSPHTALKPDESGTAANILPAAPIRQRLSKRTWMTMLVVLFLIPLTIYAGVHYLDDRKYYFISMLIIMETMLPMVMIFEDQKPLARELILISVLCAIAVAGRAAFFMIPQFKPVVAIIIISAVAFGGETGFIVGAVTAFVSNIFFGQGPWTPWQMFALGSIGFLAGVLFRGGLLRRSTLPLCLFGWLAAFFVYGGIMNPASVLMFQNHPTKEMFYLIYLQGLPFDLVHATSTAVFLLLLAKPMLEKLDRIKVKYNLRMD